MSTPDIIKLVVALVAFLLGVMGFVIWIVRSIVSKRNDEIVLLFKARNDHEKRIATIEATILSMDPVQTHLLRPRR